MKRNLTKRVLAAAALAVIAAAVSACGSNNNNGNGSHCPQLRPWANRLQYTIAGLGGASVIILLPEVARSPSRNRTTSIMTKE